MKLSWNRGESFTCSAPISFNGRLLTREFVNLTRMTLCSRWILSNHNENLRLKDKGWPARFIKEILEVLFQFHNRFYDNHQLLCRLHQLVSIRRWSADLIHCRPRRSAHRNERWITADFKFSQYSIDGCGNRTFGWYYLFSIVYIVLKAKNWPNEKVQFHLKINLFLELRIDFLTDFFLKLS